MQVQKNSFINNFKLPEQKVGSGQTFTATTSDRFESSNKKDNATKYVSIGLGLAAIAVALVKHKQIGGFLSKLFTQKVKSGENIKPPTEPPKPHIVEKPPVVQPKPKFELPKPEFKFNETNPVEYAKEKEAYMKNIICYADKDEKTALEVMEHFDKYGSNDLLANLLTPVLCMEKKTGKVADKYLKLYDKFTKDEANLESISTAPLIAMNQYYGDVLSKDSISLIIKGINNAGDSPRDLLDIRGFIKGDQYYHPFLEKFNQADLDEIDKLAKEAEEIVRKRVYSD